MDRSISRNTPSQVRVLSQRERGILPKIFWQGSLYADVELDWERSGRESSPPSAIPVLKPIDVIVVTARTAHAFGPAILRQIRLAGVFIRELTLEICNGHLMDLQGVILFFPHGLVSRGVGPICHSERLVSHWG